MARLVKRPNVALVVSIVSALVSVYVGAESLGVPMRMVHVVGLFAAGFASGSSFLKAKMDWKAARAARTGDQ